LSKHFTIKQQIKARWQQIVSGLFFLIPQNPTLLQNTLQNLFGHLARCCRYSGLGGFLGGFADDRT